MNLEYVVIGSLYWKIFWDKDIVDAIGLCHFDTQEIWIQRDLNPISQKHVFLHELLHAIWYSYNLTPRKSELEEDIVSVMTVALLQVLKDNNKVASYLAEKSIGYENL